MTQERLRKCCQIARMVEFVRGGGFWTRAALNEWTARHGMPENTPLIQISIFEDGQHFLHDGHHRAVSTVGGGRDYFREDEYEIKRWSYRDYLEVVFEESWVTPFDPRTEIRLADFLHFKETAMWIRRMGHGELALDYIRQHKMLYCKPREIHSVSQLWNSVSASQTGVESDPRKILERSVATSGG